MQAGRLRYQTNSRARPGLRYVLSGPENRGYGCGRRLVFAKLGRRRDTSARIDATESVFKHKAAAMTAAHGGTA